jgi:5-oxoprolinase (ATP-hydrolysing)
MQTAKPDNAVSADPADQGWRFWIDRGGTFTDVLAIAADGQRRSLKLLSVAPGRYDDAVLTAIREVLGLAPAAPIPEGAVAELRVGTTITTNAMLEGQVARSALLLTEGFTDLLRIGDQARPDLFRLAIDKFPPLHEWTVAIRARVSAEGEALRPVDETAIRHDLATLRDAGCEAIAIALVHAARWPAHEQAIEALAREAGFRHVVCSHQVSALPGLLDRARTALVDAALTPLLDEYRARLRSVLPGVCIRFMQSSGGLVDIDRVRARDSLLSGPAGGVIGASRIAEAAGCGRIVAFDMGGTSTDVFHHDGELERQPHARIGGQLLRVPMLAIHTVAAGGGSRIHFDGERLRVGPGSAGAHPGPACYGRGGPITVTDANLLLGRVRAESFAPVFGPDGDAPLDLAASRAGFSALAETVSQTRGEPVSVESLAWGAISVAVDNMANAVRRISVRRGIDLEHYTLVAFGGAGPQHACAVADNLGIGQVLIPDHASALSALGIGLSDLLEMREQAIEKDLSDCELAPLRAAASALADGADAALRAQGVPAPETQTRLRLRYRHADTSLELRLSDTLRADFEAEHQQRFGYIDQDRPIEVVSVLAHASGGGASLGADPRGDVASPQLDPVRVYMAPQEDQPPQWCELPQPQPPMDDAIVVGPALVPLASSSLLLQAGWQLRRVRRGWLAERTQAKPGQRRGGCERDPVRLEIFNNRFMSVAEQMGEALQRSAQSVNVRERLDYSCAVFDRNGQLIANAPHIPVHLGSMGVSVRHILRTKGGELAPGDAWLLNDPYAGGTHLPDLTVISPVFDADDGSLRAFVASRAHHADIGGISPGSMPADSRHIDEEGVLFNAFPLTRGGRFLEAELRQALAAGAMPSRNLEANVADLRAQLAANQRGAALLAHMDSTFGADLVSAYMAHVQDAAEEAVRRRISSIAEGQHALRMDNGATLQVRISPELDAAGRPGLHVDFSGTSAQTGDNFNAPKAVVKAALLYVLRCLIDDDIPLNEGCLRPVRLSVPEASLLSPRHPAAVVAGNVETSQCVVDALLGALGAQAGSQGTMNNLSFGNARHQYYETVCGGAGAGADFNGASAVHTHMTNSRITDVEIIEQRFPVRLEHFGIRQGSGGVGARCGGDGAIRQLRFLATMDVALLGNHRASAPRGLADGGNAKPGRNTRILADGSEHALPATIAYRAEAGETLRIETPGGGGYGPPAPKPDPPA